MTNVIPDDILTARLRLRALRPEDAVWIAHEMTNPRVHEWLTTPPSPYGLDDARDFVLPRVGTPRIRAIEAADRPVGVIGLEQTRGPALEFGFWLAEAAWGRGLMSEAAAAMVDWHWTTSTKPLVAGWISGNDRSAAILRKLGFKPNGSVTRRSNYLGRDVTLDRVRMKRRAARAA